MANEYTCWAERLFDPGRASEKPEALKGVRVFDPGIVVMVGRGYLTPPRP